MIRWSVLAAGTAAAMAAAFVSGASVPTKEAKPPAEVKADAPRPPVVVGQKTGYFNMAKVMREFKKAKTSVEGLNTKRQRLSTDLSKARTKYLALQGAVAKATDAKAKEELTEEMLGLARQVEDMDRKINKQLNEMATAIIVGLHDDIRATVVAIAREKRLIALLAYPDAVTPEEAENPAIKELKLKPPALHPFYLDPSADFSDEIIRRLNEKFVAENDD